jgi:hypothetical protein
VVLFFFLSERNRGVSRLLVGLGGIDMFVISESTGRGFLNSPKGLRRNSYCFRRSGAGLKSGRVVDFRSRILVERIGELRAVKKRVLELLRFDARGGRCPTARPPVVAVAESIPVAIVN